jgi:hypothetical protein
MGRAAFAKDVGRHSIVENAARRSMCDYLSRKLDTDLKRAAETGRQVIGRSVEDENTFESILAPELCISMLIVFLPISLYILMVY